jgi:ribosome-binding protein aMBF1 (putative translation factor)
MMKHFLILMLLFPTWAYCESSETEPPKEPEKTQEEKKEKAPPEKPKKEEKTPLDIPPALQEQYNDFAANAYYDDYMSGRPFSITTAPFS